MHYCDIKGNYIALTSVLFLAFSLIHNNNLTATTYTFNGTGYWSDAGNWDANGIPPSTLTSGNTIVIAPSDYCELTTNLVIEAGGILTVHDNKDFRSWDFGITISGTFNMLGVINSDAGFNLAITPTGVLNKNGTIFVHGSLHNQGIINDSGGSWNIGGMGCINEGTFYLSNYSQIRIEPSRAFYNDGSIEINSPASIENNGNFTNNSSLLINGEFMNGNFFESGTLINNGIINGSGTLYNDGDFNNGGSGIIAPGMSPGTLFIAGDFDIGSGTYIVEIDGTVQGTTYDWVSVSGTATIGGSSLLEIVFGYTPAAGATFDILTAASISGTFSFPSNISFSGGNVGAIELSYPGGNTLRVTVSSLLPVELVNFEAKPQGSHVQLKWETANEQNNKGFEIQRSTDANKWVTLGFVQGYGTTLATKEYVFIDKLPFQGVNYYQLRQIDFDNGEDFSSIKTVNLKENGNAINIFPNPAKNEANLMLYSDFSGEATISLYNVYGKQINNIPIFINKGQYHLNLELSDLPAGGYWLEIIARDKRWNSRLTLK